MPAAAPYPPTPTWSDTEMADATWERATPRRYRLRRTVPPRGVKRGRAASDADGHAGRAKRSRVRGRGSAAPFERQDWAARGKRHGEAQEARAGGKLRRTGRLDGEADEMQGVEEAPVDPVEEVDASEGAAPQAEPPGEMPRREPLVEVRTVETGYVLVQVQHPDGVVQRVVIEKPTF